MHRVRISAALDESTKQLIAVTVDRVTRPNGRRRVTVFTSGFV